MPAERFPGQRPAPAAAARSAWLSPVVLLLLALPAACGEEDAPIYEGEPGQPVALSLSAWVPAVKVELTAEGTGVWGSSQMLVDTGAPLTLISHHAFPGLPYGKGTATLKAFALTFPSYPVVVDDMFSGSGVCRDLDLGGLVGGDLLRFFRLGLDYKGKRAFLFDGPGPDAAVGSGTEAARQVPVEVRGGGLAKLDKVSDYVRVPATRVMILQALVEGTTKTAIVDTGASYTVLPKSLLAALGGSGRPTLCCIRTATFYGTFDFSVVRLKELILGSAKVRSMPVLVWDDEAYKTATGNKLFDLLSQEVGQEVSLLVGGSFLRHFAVRLDYGGRILELARYLDQTHVSSNEWVGPGFSFCQAKNANEGMIVVDVYKGTDAETRGVVPGATLLAVDGTSVLGRTESEVKDLMLQKPVGSTVGLTFKATSGSIDLNVKVERLLAEYQ